MKKNISTQSLKASIGEVVDAVRLRGDRYIIVRRGKPVAAIVPLNVSEAFERKQIELFALMERVSRRNANIPTKRIDEAISQAIREVRGQRRRARRS